MAGVDVQERYEGPPADGTGAAPASPQARRLRPPSWLDLRLITGVLLVLVAVVVGARVLAGADHSSTVWGLSHDVAAGTRLRSDDLTKVKVRLFSDADRYLTTDTSPAGQMTTRALGAGELLPSDALQQVPRSAVVPMAVDPAHIPPGLAHGDRVDIWAAAKDAGSGRPGRPRQVLSGVTVQSVQSGRSNFSSSNEVQVTVQIPPGQESTLVTAAADSTVYLVQSLGGQATTPTPHS